MVFYVVLFFGRRLKSWEIDRIWVKNLFLLGSYFFDSSMNRFTRIKFFFKGLFFIIVVLEIVFYVLVMVFIQIKDFS